MPHPSNHPQIAPKRVIFLDALRLLAAVQMVQGHSLDAVLSEALRRGFAFELWSFTRGLTSTAFLLAAGVSFAVLSVEGLRFERARARRLRRAAKLVLIGYLMHAPFGMFVGQPLDEALRELGIVDVLQCIGVGLLLLELLALATPNVRTRAFIALSACAVLFTVAPWADRMEPEGVTRLLSHYLTARGGSVFPLSPWLGYMAAGYAVGALVLDRGVVTPRERQVRGLLGACLAASLVTVGAALLGGVVSSSGGLVDPKLGLSFLLLKLTLVLGVAAFLAWSLRARAALPPLWTRLSGETLFLYVSHVVVLYAAGIGLQSQIGPTQPVWVGLLLAVVLFVVCSACALQYRRLGNALRAR